MVWSEQEREGWAIRVSVQTQDTVRKLHIWERDTCAP